jgi:hypothetical protein
MYALQNAVLCQALYASAPAGCCVLFPVLILSYVPVLCHAVLCSHHWQLVGVLDGPCLWYLYGIIQ